MMMPGGASLPGLQNNNLPVTIVGPVSVAPPGNKGINEGRLLLPAFKDHFTFP